MFTINELIDLVIMTVAIGYIFSTFIKRQPTTGYDPIAYFKQNQIIEDIKFGIIIAAPAIVFHELAHKFVAMAFGAAAILHAPLGWYAAVIIMRLLNFVRKMEHLTRKQWELSKMLVLWHKRQKSMALMTRHF